MKVATRTEETLLENDSGKEVEGVRVRCSRCGHETESFGTGPNSVARCRVLLRKECPNNEENYYV